MNLQTFRAPTMAEALQQVKSIMGPDAVILHTRTYQRSVWLGLRRREIVEITAGRGLNVAAPRRPAARPVSVTTKAAFTTAKSAHSGKELLDTPAAGRIIMMGISDEMRSLKAIVQDLSLQVRHQAKPQIPEELFDHYTQLVSNQVCDGLATDIIGKLFRQLRPEQLKQPEFIKDRLAEQIEKLIPTAGPILRTKSSGPHVVALIGPTGVGKTTTIAKLAANLQLKDKRRVGLITIDTYRIAASDQLKKYADILRSNLRIVSSPEELGDAIASMSDCEYILIDTAGRSPNDALKLSELKNFILRAQPDEVHMVVSATCCQESVELAIQKFSDVRCDRLIFTKLDEAAHVGVVLNVLKKMNKPVSYVTTGQNVPNDIEVGRGKWLAQMILGNTL